MRLTAGLLTGAVAVLTAGGAVRMPVSWPGHVSITYSLRLDPAHLDVADVAIRVDSAPEAIRLAMKIHAEYNAGYWRFLDSMRVDGTSNDARASATRNDSTLWRVTLPGGRGVIRYRVHIQRSAGAARRAWQSFARSTGALINSPDFFLYLPDFVNLPVRLTLDVPRDWRVATSLTRRGHDNEFTASSGATFLDSPILLGALREWSFRYKATDIDVAYWPLPDATPFDTAAFVDGLRRLSAAAIDVFGRAPEARFHFLIQDGAGDALEHQGSVTIGVRSSDLANNPQASMTEIAHEFFHTWNLVAIRPDDYGALTFRATPPTTGLWWGEGVTMHYADVLPRRAGLRGEEPSRLVHLQHLLENYYASSWSGRVSPAAASLAFGKSPVDDPNASGGYYVQGQLLAIALDAAIRDSTREARGLDDVMRTLFAQSARGRGFTEAGLEATVDSTCRCRLDAVFANQVRRGAMIDLTEALRRIGFRAIVDTIPAADSVGRPLPDLRLATDFTRPAAPLRLVVWNTTTAWAIGGLRSGDELIAIGGHAIMSFADLQRELHALHVGDHATVDVRRNGAPIHVDVLVAGYGSPRVRFVDVANGNAQERVRRERWMAGR